MEWQTMSDGSRIRWDGMRPVCVRANYSQTHSRIRTGADLRATLRAGPYAWPGGYPLYFIASDGEALSFDAVRENLAQCVRSIRYRSRDGWRIVACEVNWEDPALHCSHTGARIASAYAEPEEIPGDGSGAEPGPAA